MTEIFFATNRAPYLGAQGGFGTALSPVTSYGRATVPTASGSISVAPTTAGAWSDADIDAIVSADRDVVVFVHGFGYKFADALADAALYQSLLLTAGVSVTMLTFDFAETGVEIGFPWPSAPYFDSQARAKTSAGAMAAFLSQLATLRFNLLQRCPGRRVTVLCHSMGNFLLAEALSIYPVVAAGPPMADAFILAAADEVFDSFDPITARLARLFGILAPGGQVAVLISHHDEALMVSDCLLNHHRRLGYSGPKSPVAGISVIDCTPEDPLRPDPDETHQYYRLPEIVTKVAAIVAPSKLN